MTKKEARHFAWPFPILYLQLWDERNEIVPYDDVKGDRIVRHTGYVKADYGNLVSSASGEEVEEVVNGLEIIQTGALEHVDSEQLFEDKRPFIIQQSSIGSFNKDVQIRSLSSEPRRLQPKERRIEVDIGTGSLPNPSTESIGWILERIPTVGELQKEAITRNASAGCGKV